MTQIQWLLKMTNDRIALLQYFQKALAEKIKQLESKHSNIIQFNEYL